MAKTPKTVAVERLPQATYSLVTFPGGRQRKVCRLSRGGFAAVYQTCDGGPVQVLAAASARRGDSTKEVLARIARDERSPHLPRVSQVGRTPDGYHVYAMPKYKAPLRAADSQRAWRQLRALVSCLDGAQRQVVQRVGPTGISRGGEVNQRTIRCAEDRREVTPGLLNALELLADYAAEYSDDMTFEFSRENAAVGGRGQLVLLDPLVSVGRIRTHGNALAPWGLGVLGALGALRRNTTR